MFTVLIIGNSQSYRWRERIITPADTIPKLQVMIIVQTINYD